MIVGISTSRNCAPSAPCLASAGKAFVIRYYSRTTKIPEKRMLPAEAQALAQAGLNIAVVYQDRARETDDFGTVRGRQDADSALAAAAQIGQPSGSAIYFAVDVNFTKDQVLTYVRPYFEAIRSVWSAAHNGAPLYRIGVYGSGLTCRLLKQAGLAELTWLAEATGWRESATYAEWDVRQAINKKNLCGIGSDWEHCEAKGDFGAFRPLGFDLVGEELSPTMRVAATSLNLRDRPSAEGNRPITLLPNLTPVKVLGPSAPGWSRVEARLGGAVFTGHVADRFLEPIPAQVWLDDGGPPTIPPAYWQEGRPEARRNSVAGQASPIGEVGRPTRDIHAPAGERIQQLTRIVEWLEVETSARYLPRDGKTYCNVYAADYVYLAGAYLPRVWWTGAAIARLASGRTVEPIYGKTVMEMRADALYQWLIDFGSTFGWRRVASPDDLQMAANGGGIGVICADRRAEGLSGHITVVVPETDVQRAVRNASGQVQQPLQSQAGSKNKRYGSAGPNWWQDSRYIGHVMFVHD